MANPEHMAILSRGKKAWNDWRMGYSDVLPNLSAADLSNRNLRGVDLRNANLSHCNLKQADLRGILREGFKYPRFQWAADLRYANLQGAILNSANLIGGRLRGANLANANLYRADLRGAVLREADLLNANLTDADLRGVFLQQTLNISQEQIDRAIGDKSTKLPVHLRYPARWLTETAQNKSDDENQLQLFGASDTKNVERRAIETLFAPISLIWSHEKISVDRPSQTIRAESTSLAQEPLALTQAKLSREISDSLTRSNADPRLSQYLNRYSLEAKQGSKQLNILHLDTLWRTVSHYYRNNEASISDIDASAVKALSDNHRVLRETYPEWKDFDSLLKAIDVPDPGVPLGEELRQVVTEPPAEDVFELEARQQIREETEQPDKMPGDVLNKAKPLGLAAIIVLLWNLLNQAPRAVKNWQAVETLTKKIKPLLDVVRNNFQDYLS